MTAAPVRCSIEEGTGEKGFPRRGKAFVYQKRGFHMNTDKVITRDNENILHTYGRSQIVLAEGHGMTAKDAT